MLVRREFGVWACRELKIVDRRHNSDMDFGSPMQYETVKKVKKERERERKIFGQRVPIKTTRDDWFQGEINKQKALSGILKAISSFSRLIFRWEVTAFLALCRTIDFHLMYHLTMKCPWSDTWRMTTDRTDWYYCSMYLLPKVLAFQWKPTWLRPWPLCLSTLGDLLFLV